MIMNMRIMMTMVVSRSVGFDAWEDTINDIMDVKDGEHYSHLGESG